jgi:hypothetical protein
MLSGHGCGGADQLTAIQEDQSQTIAGRVTAVDGVPVAGAEVALEPLAMTTITDGAGRFAFTVTSSGDGTSEYILEVRSEGYETVSLQVLVGAAGTATLDITLESIPSESEPEPEPEPTGIVVTSSSVDAVMCIAAGVELPFTVRIENEGLVPVEAIVLHDTLDTGPFSRALTSSDIMVDRSTFPGAVVELNPDGRSFRVELGTLPPMATVEVYTVTLPAAAAGVFCNRVSAVGAGALQLASDHSCVTNTLEIEIDLVNEDGAIVGGQFTAAPEVFHIGDGGPARPDALVFRVLVANRFCGTMENASLASVTAARSGRLEFREILPGFPSRGTVDSTSVDGFVWTIGTLEPDEEAELLFRAEAVAAGEEVHRVVLEVPGPIGELVNEEPITIQP